MLHHSTLLLIISLFLPIGNSHLDPCDPQDPTEALARTQALSENMDWPSDLDITYFAGPEIVPSPACLATSLSGEVFVGVDMQGSLGKDPGKGKIVKLSDCNKDGVADSHTVFAEVDNPRGILPIGDKVYVLYTTFSEATGAASGMDLVVFEDRDANGVADGPSQVLIHNISSPKFLQDRGTDHSTNGIRMGIDGWIYIAVGDFGFHGAVDRSGKRMTQLGGGIVRVRPDGTEMEVYTHGLRNIYDVAIDPYMNIFTRGNTNDGGGWNIRFIHHIQSGEYGYPVLFKHFTDEILPALVDVGGGSGAGAFFLDDPRWPEAYNQQPLMADWGRNQIFIHSVEPDGASFTQKEQAFIELPQVSDLDLDGTGQLFLSAWDGAGYRGNPDKGYVIRAVPKGWEQEELPALSSSSLEELAQLLRSPAAVVRLHASQELLQRSAQGPESAHLAWELATDTEAALPARIAGLFTYAQIEEEGAIEHILTLVEEDAMRKFALRALTDRKGWNSRVPMEPFIQALADPSERVQVAARVGLGRIGKKSAAEALLQTPIPSSWTAPAIGTEGLHASPNASIIPAHVAVRALVELNAVDACVAAIGTAQSDLALWALRYMHDPKAVKGLTEAFTSTDSPTLQHKILTTLSRLYHQEAPYDGSWWWSTRPDTHGPYYKGIPWGQSPVIEAFLWDVWKNGTTEQKALLTELNGRHRMKIEALGGTEELAAEQKSEVALGAIANKKGQVSRASIEDVMLAIEDLEGDPVMGKKLFTQQGCVACHSLEKGEPMKGPFMGQVGSHHESRPDCRIHPQTQCLYQPGLCLCPDHCQGQ